MSAQSPKQGILKGLVPCFPHGSCSGCARSWALLLLGSLPFPWLPSLGSFPALLILIQLLLLEHILLGRNCCGPWFSKGKIEICIGLWVLEVSRVCVQCLGPGPPHWPPCTDSCFLAPPAAMHSASLKGPQSTPEQEPGSVGPSSCSPPSPLP